MKRLLAFGVLAVLFPPCFPRDIFRWTPGEGVSRHQKPSGYTGEAPFQGREPGSNGLSLDAQGHLVLCQHGDRRIARRERDGRLAPVDTSRPKRGSPACAPPRAGRASRQNGDTR